ncbi:uncharacterized protein LOC143343323 [Colletes latitarsis]|uniref:uncharacterized protein LOC143343323 n=1 Tax=Colletes latitarsis TaxID=2605962 RepID=UPI004035A9CD
MIITISVPSNSTSQLSLQQHRKATENSNGLNGMEKESDKNMDKHAVPCMCEPFIPQRGTLKAFSMECRKRPSGQHRSSARMSGGRHLCLRKWNFEFYCQTIDA